MKREGMTCHTTLVTWKWPGCFEGLAPPSEGREERRIMFVSLNLLNMYLYTRFVGSAFEAVHESSYTNTMDITEWRGQRLTDNSPSFLGADNLHDWHRTDLRTINLFITDKVYLWLTVSRSPRHRRLGLTSWYFWTTRMHDRGCHPAWPARALPIGVNKCNIKQSLCIYDPYTECMRTLAIERILSIYFILIT